MSTDTTGAAADKENSSLACAPRSSQHLNYHGNNDSLQKSTGKTPLGASSAPPTNSAIVGANSSRTADQVSNASGQGSIKYDPEQTKAQMSLLRSRLQSLGRKQSNTNSSSFSQNNPVPSSDTTLPRPSPRPTPPAAPSTGSLTSQSTFTPLRSTPPVFFENAQEQPSQTHRPTDEAKRNDLRSVDEWWEFLVQQYQSGSAPEELLSLLRATIFPQFESEKAALKYNDNYLNLWLLFAKLQPPGPAGLQERHEIYRRMYKDGIGRKRASLYLNWVNFESKQNHQQCIREVLHLAIQNEAEPASRIHECLAQLGIALTDVQASRKSVSQVQPKPQHAPQPSANSTHSTQPQHALQPSANSTHSTQPQHEISSSHQMIAVPSQQLRADPHTGRSSISNAAPANDRMEVDSVDPVEEMPVHSVASQNVAGSSALSTKQHQQHQPLNQAHQLNQIHPQHQIAQSNQQQRSSAVEAKLLDMRTKWTQASQLLNMGVLLVRGTPYLNLGRIGHGGSSKVYKALSAANMQVYAVKVVPLADQDDSVIRQYINEITLLKNFTARADEARALQRENPNAPPYNHTIIELIDFEHNKDKKLLLIVLEFAEIDLHRMLKNYGGHLIHHANLLRYYWEGMLRAVQTVHEHRIVHSDLKPPNFVVAKGQVKLIDFGIAKAISQNTTNIVRQDIIGTMNYMAPEAIGGVGGGSSKALKVGRPADVWALGCILYQMVYGAPPFAHIDNFIQKLQVIGNPSYKIEFHKHSHGVPVPEHLIDVMESCLRREAKERPTIPELLEHPMLRSM